MTREERPIYENLKELRKSFGFSQEQIARYLNINRAAVVLMEKGKRNIKNKELNKLAELYELTMDAITNGIKLKDIKNDKLKIKMFENVLLYVLGKCGANPNVGKTVIYKLLFFIDFFYYKEHKRSLTGIEYVRFPRGPVPYDFDNLVDKMEERGELTRVSTEYHGKLQYKLIPNKEPDKGSLKPEEIVHINDIIDKYGNMNASQISYESHRQLPWRIAPDMCEIDYKLADQMQELD